MLEELQAIKEQLFDAPSEVKESFNEVVKYFSLDPIAKRRLKELPSEIKALEDKLSELKKGGYVYRGKGDNDVEILKSKISFKKEQLENYRKWDKE